MATVPGPVVGGSVAPSVGPTVAPQPRQYRSTQSEFLSGQGVTPDSFGAQIAQGQIAGGQKLGTFADEAAQLALKMQADDNEREAEKLQTQFVTQMTTLNYGDGTPQNKGYLSLNGDAAVAGAPAAKQAILDARKALLDSASNDHVRKVFQFHSDREIGTQLNRMGSFVNAQRDVADAASYTGYAAAQVEKGVLDPSLVEDSRQSITAAAISEYTRRGITNPDAQAQFIRSAVTPLYQGIINKYLSEDSPQGTAAAFQTLATYGPAMDNVVRENLQVKLNHASALTQGQLRADEAFSQFPGDPAKGMAYLASVTSGKTRAEAETEYLKHIQVLHSMASEQRARAGEARAQASFARTEEDRKALGTGQQVAYKIFNELPGSPKAQEAAAYAALKDDPKALEQTLTHLRQLNTVEQSADWHARAALNDKYTQDERARTEAQRALADSVMAHVEKGGSYEGLSVEQRIAADQVPGLAGIAEKRARQVSGQEPVSTNYAEYDRLMNLSPQQRVAEFKGGVGLAKAATMLAPAEFNDVKRNYEADLKGQPDHVNAIVSSVASGLGLDDNDMKEERGRFREQTRLAIERAQEVKKSRLTDKEIDTIAHEVGDRRTVERWYGSTTVLGSEVKPTDKPVVSELLRRQIRDAYLANQGRRPTEDEIVAKATELSAKLKAQGADFRKAHDAMMGK